MFRVANLVLLSKVDLLPHLAFDNAACIANIRKVAPHAEILELSTTTGAGMTDLAAWLDSLVRGPRRIPEQAPRSQQSLRAFAACASKRPHEAAACRAVPPPERILGARNDKR
ncbi:MAG: hypothetical protein KF894_30895 [Labilithrix sp.]|nr:hypothetical protein [Labilithrix sp.]